ncbi:MAG: 3-hydroxy-3-methylglutaryl-CoA reductase, partial [Streptococcus mitis]|nr:3-hydroxy-3-methylglutaryl-CoA reductase [Streptococcus mitis]
MKISWNGFSKKSYQERLELLQAQALLSTEKQTSLEQDEQMSVTVADQLSENVVGTFSLPYSLVPEVLVNGQEYTVPYVTEEPSVVAAASYASKIIKRAGGFTAQVHERQMIGQVALYQVDAPEQAQAKIASKKAELLELANQAYPSIVKRGGGARDLHVEQIKGETDFLVVYLHVDTQEAMGANMLNTMLEALKPVLEELSQGQSLMGILSNYATDSLVTASCRIAFRYLSRQRDQGREIAEKIALDSQFAQADPYRAATHNKGI